jgi:hypothetical protein
MKMSIKLFHWLPRVICIGAILFISLFSADAFEHGDSLSEKLVALIMHLIPSLVLLSFLIIAWKWEIMGGIIFTIVGLALSPYVFMLNYNMNHSIWMSMGIIMSITIPFFIVGILFLASHYMKKRNLIEN